MDDSRPLAVESFSTSWLSNAKQSHDATSKMMDYTIVKPSRFLEEAQSFKFNTPIHPSVIIAHADELFFDGSIRPVYISHATLGVSNTSDFVPVKHNSSIDSLTSSSSIGNHCCHSRRWRRSLRKLLKTFGCLGPICRKRNPGEINWIDDIKQNSCDVKSQHESLRVSPRSNIGSSSGDWSHLETSISEAILHCKREMISLTRRKVQKKDNTTDFWKGSSMATCSLSFSTLAISLFTSFSKEKFI